MTKRELIISTKAHDVTLNCYVVFNADKRSHYEFEALQYDDTPFQLQRFNSVKALFEKHNEFILGEYAELALECYNDDSIAENI